MKRKLDFQEVRERQLALLDYIAEVCQKHHIRWFLVYGTLIGAVRHQGYIPWDDDVDIAMLRPDYERFLHILKKEPHNHFKLLDMDTSPWYFNEFAKIHDGRTRVRHASLRKHQPLGIFIDVFPIDRYNVLHANHMTRILDRIRYYAYIDRATLMGLTGRFFRIKKVVWYLLHITPPRFWGRLIQLLVHFLRKKNGRYEGNLVSCFGEKECFPKNTFNETTTMLFEGRRLPVPKDYDHILRQWYGDYWTLPPEEERERGHFEDAYE